MHSSKTKLQTKSNSESNLVKHVCQISRYFGSYRSEYLEISNSSSECSFFSVCSIPIWRARINGDRTNGTSLSPVVDDNEDLRRPPRSCTVGETVHWLSLCTPLKQAPATLCRGWISTYFKSNAQLNSSSNGSSGELIPPRHKVAGVFLQGIEIR